MDDRAGNDPMNSKAVYARSEHRVGEVRGDVGIDAAVPAAAVAHGNAFPKTHGGQSVEDHEGRHDMFGCFGGELHHRGILSLDSILGDGREVASLHSFSFEAQS